jgi:hypothetical protein
VYRHFHNEMPNFVFGCERERQTERERQKEREREQVANCNHNETKRYGKAGNLKER